MPPVRFVLHVVEADRDDRAAAEDGEPDRDEEAAQLPVLAEEAEATRRRPCR